MVEVCTERIFLSHISQFSWPQQNGHSLKVRILEEYFYFFDIWIFSSKWKKNTDYFHLNTWVWKVGKCQMSTQTSPRPGNRRIIYNIGIGNTLVGNYEYWRNSFIKFTILQKWDNSYFLVIFWRNKGWKKVKTAFSLLLEI